MSEYKKLSRQAQQMKELYPAGTRVLLMQMGEDPRPIPPGTRGTVVAVDDIGTVHCTFDNGRSLGLIPGEDSFRKLTEAEQAEEQASQLTEGTGPVMGL